MLPEQQQYIIESVLSFFQWNKSQS
jgi:hypothetical protein